MTEFTLHPRLAADTIFFADWPLSRVLLMNDARYPWIVLVPRISGLSEIHELAAEDRAVLMEEIARTSQALNGLTDAAKINVGALGNVVPQLHVHVVARRPGDFAWPGPVWGQGTATPYEPAELQAMVANLRRRL